MKRWLWIWIAASLLLAGCQPVITSVTLAPPEVWRVQVTPALRYLNTAFHDCTAKLSAVTLLYDEKPAAALDPAQADFTIGLEPAPGAAYTAILSRSELALIVNPASPISELSRADLFAIFNGNAAAWADLAKTDCPACAGSALQAIQPYVYAEGDDVGRVFDTLVPGVTHKLASAILAPNPQAVRQAVAANPQAAGMVPAPWLDSTVKPVTISDAPPGGFAFAIVFSAASEPQGKKLSWLLCVQNEINP